MPVSRITKRTEQMLIVHKQVTGLSNPKLLELAVLQVRIIPVGKVLKGGGRVRK